MSALQAAYGLWVAFFVSWFAAAVWADRPARRAGARAEFAYRVVTLIGCVLLFQTAPSWQPHLWWTPEGVQWALVALAVAGYAFCWWARLHLGRLWSATVTRKPDHRVVDTGPYRYVRHPIYTGILAAMLGLALMKGTSVALAGFAITVLGFWIKARLEERFLRAELGPEAYDAYAARTPMLAPFAPR